MLKTLFNHLLWILKRSKTNAKHYEKIDREIIQYYSSGSINLQNGNFLTKEEGKKKIKNAIQIEFT